jgi:hypothetical protein
VVAAIAQAVPELDPVTPPVFELPPQRVHAAAPVSDLYVSAAQAVGARPFGPVYPAAATQAVLVMEPDTPPVAVLLGQGVHAAAPVSDLNVSAAQAVGVPPLGPL